MPSAITRLKKMLPTTVIQFSMNYSIPPKLKDNYNLGKE
jgi:hypothetical protein